MAAMSYFCAARAGTNDDGGAVGWDDARHHELLSAGCVPYFYDLPAAGPYILPHFPKKFLMDVLKKTYFSHIGRVTHADGDDELFALPPVRLISGGGRNSRPRVA